MDNIIKGRNPVIAGDFPDVDVIRVDDTYYMVSTTMYFMPGAVILRSYDLINWEYCCHVYDKLADTDRENLMGDKHAYGNGMWAPCIRYHDGVFHVIFAANDTRTTYNFTSTDIMGPWTMNTIEGFYHDASVLFDDDGRVYIVSGNRDIRIVELESDLSKPKEGGLDKVIIRDHPRAPLGLEGSHIYKINGKYYIFFIHSSWKRWFRIEACYMCDTLDGVWAGGDVIESDVGNLGTSGVAQGGIVDMPDGKWAGMIFSDMGASGRMPNFVPMHFDERSGFPVFDTPTLEVENYSTRPGYEYAPIFVSDDFDYTPDENGVIKLNEAWEFNHNPVNSHWTVRDGSFTIKTEKLAPSLDLARNTLTQRTAFPKCEAIVTVDASALNDGDRAGLSVMQYHYGLIGVAKENGAYKLVMRSRAADGEFKEIEHEYASVPLQNSVVTLKAVCEFGHGKEFCEFFYLSDGEWKQLGIRQYVRFDLRHFTGCRFGLFSYSTEKVGGEAKFSKFIYNL